MRVIRVYNFFDLDGGSITVREIHRTHYPTHDVIRGIVIHCTPIERCLDFLGKEVTIEAAELEDFVFNRIEIPLAFFRKIEVYNISGTLEPYQGTFHFVYGLPSTIFINRLSIEDKEVFYRRMYLNAISRISGIMQSLDEESEKNIKTLTAVVQSCKDIIRKYNELMARTFGIVATGPEGLMAMEGVLSMLQPPSPPQQQAAAQAPSPRPSRAKQLLSKVGSFIKRLIAGLRGRGAAK